ncbi:energy transducer TonB [Rufibacter hautae]|uniref:Energy transducer TonB n=1 Tax=Rufibacter hautae TaxID=2595005 RepID=A0A5B6TBU4_9BACT|nr:energy transducer TonB [Rufibacter hautae]KAA3437080.1 energy transducer TonB [Rufibacter hautae]
MKKVVLSMGMVLALSFASHAQQAPDNSSNPQDSTRIYTVEEVDQAPLFSAPKYAKYGEGAIHRFLANSFRIPPVAQRHGVNGEGVYSFVIDAQGNLSDFKIIKSLDPSVDAEALRVLKLTKGHWKPAMKGGSAVPVAYTYPYRIRTM